MLIYLRVEKQFPEIATAAGRNDQARRLERVLLSFELYGDFFTLSKIAQ